ncbi:MAG: LppX_LprAFG lipoprotein [Acidimicrobiia bacterium]|nr:LppX_LprAFG lipoprotein [Acidimicrobiia bacterium]
MRPRALFLVALLTAACGDTATPPPDAAALVQGAVAAMQSVASARFEMTRAGAPITVEGLVFDSAVGRYAAPAAAEAVLRMRAGDLTVQLGTISMGERTWLTDPLTNRWHELRPGSGFNPAVLFDPDDGWVALLGDLSAVRGVPAEAGTYRLAGRVPAARVEALTAGLAPGQEVPVDVWLDASTLHIIRLEFSTVGDEGKSDWVIVMSDFDLPVQIDPPAVG